jgi:Cysteine rich repeat
MIRFLFAASLVLTTGSAFAQGARENDACARDVSRFCRARMNDGDSAVLACLKEHRARLSKACEKVLTEHGQ